LVYGPGRITGPAADVTSDLVSDFRGALDRDELTPVFQPIHRLSDGETVGFEALMRWQHPVHGAVGPATFIPMSEQDGSIVAPGAWMIRRALDALSRWRRTPGGAGLFVAVNLSPAQLGGGGFAGHCDRMLSLHGLDRAALHLELTETTPLTFEHAAEEIRSLHEAGFRLAIDDFGTGFSSLAYVHRLPFRTLKIDRMFVRDLPDVRDARVIVTSVIQLAHDLGMEVVAEGVETDAQRRFLQGVGCDFAQGYLFGRPAPADKAAV
jgi:EAL domain-containing protein (putative c-di-GMP-specific phosphodiesterase class I)